MSIHVDQDSERERRMLRKVNVLFLKRLELERRRAERNHRARDRYNAEDDFARSIDEAYAVIRERVAAGGKGWTPP